MYAGTLPCTPAYEGGSRRTGGDPPLYAATFNMYAAVLVQFRHKYMLPPEKDRLPYKVPFLVNYCRLADDISLFKQDHSYNVPFFVDYSTNYRNRQNRIIDKIN